MCIFFLLWLKINFRPAGLVVRLNIEKSDSQIIIADELKQRELDSRML